MYSVSEPTMILNEKEEANIRKKSRLAVLLALLFWALVLGIPFLSYTFPPPEKPGILLAFGDENGGGENSAETSITDADVPNPSPDPSSAPQKELPAEPSKQEATAKSPRSNLKQNSDEESFLDTSTKPVEQERPTETAKSGKDRKTIDAEKLAEQEEAQKAKREADAKLKREQEEAKKREFSDLFGGTGTGSEPQKQGDPAGDPDKNKLEGISTGTGDVGVGLKDRGVLYEPEIEEDSQKIGRIVVRVCVNSKGLVTEAKYTQRGSTSTDIALIKVAEEAAGKYRFSPSGLDRQCGNISIDFKLK